MLLNHFFAMVCPLNLKRNKLGTQFHRAGKIHEDLFREDMDGIRSGERLVYTFSRDYILLQLDVLTMMIIENISWAVHVKMIIINLLKLESPIDLQRPSSTSFSIASHVSR